jgi:hypothetical protein
MIGVGCPVDAAMEVYCIGPKASDLIINLSRSPKISQFGGLEGTKRPACWVGLSSVKPKFDSGRFPAPRIVSSWNQIGTKFDF